MVKFNEKTFTKPTDTQLQKNLTKEQYNVTQKHGTEKPFENLYNSNKEEGIYIDIVSGEPLYSSLDKYDSGTGWPSFTKPISLDFVVEKADTSIPNRPRVEVLSKHAQSHLGHVFNDGPKDKGGRRYCMNSSALRFIPVEDLEKEGYGEYAKLFK